MDNILKSFQLKKIHIFNEQRTLKEAVATAHSVYSFGHLYSAVQKLSDYEISDILNLLLKEPTKFRLDEIQVKDSYEAKKIHSDLMKSIKISKAIQTGFTYTESKNKFHFNANLFADYFLERITAVCDSSGILYVYSDEGVFQEINEVELGTVIRKLMNQGLENSWKSSLESEAVMAIRRECVYVKEFNVSGEYINLKNGVLNIVTGKLEPHDPRFLSTVRIPLEYDYHAVCHKFMKYMQEITMGDEDLIKVHQEIMGYYLSSYIKAERAVYYYGRGANGKSVLANLINILVGKQNVSSIPLSQFSKSFGLEGIIGKTLNIASENEMHGSSLNTEAFKSIVSGDGITINIKYHKPITNYKSKCRLLFLGNDLPDTVDLTNGYFRKIMIVPFKRTFNEEERNRNLLEELEEELPGILNWALDGLIRLKKRNFIFSKARVIEEEMNRYRLMQDPALNFYQSMIQSVPDSRVRKPEVYNTFRLWCGEQGITTLTRQKFFKNLTNIIESQGDTIISKRIKGYEYFEGIQIRIDD